ncbi:MAG: hypothetical protein EAZ84_03400 [Verrucomicrobia bacterium]|nr:MAG: hypothetical protein EAZ84_03400 [Verrucomicrobiota bacterium]TAE87267.1 MAG: hypothetical protein EAZ82_08490 [Verrucomicrobiota bacterium]TAF25102.1 MAG: hypothetical protein EAZ71_08715 [Verrucomicrobiota bacterium]
MERLEELMIADPTIGSGDDQELEELALKIESYEREHIRIPKPTAEEMRLFRSEQAPHQKHSSEPT